MSITIRRALVEDIFVLMASGKTPAGVNLPSPYVKDRFGWLGFGRSKDAARIARNNPEVPFAGKREMARRRRQILGLAGARLEHSNGLGGTAFNEAYRIELQEGGALFAAHQRLRGAA